MTTTIERDAFFKDLRPSLEGTLEKKSEYLGRYNVRHVRLFNDGTLRWYADAEADTANGSVALAHAEVSAQESAAPSVMTLARASVRARVLATEPESGMASLATAAVWHHNARAVRARARAR